MIEYMKDADVLDMMSASVHWTSHHLDQKFPFSCLLKNNDIRIKVLVRQCMSPSLCMVSH